MGGSRAIPKRADLVDYGHAAAGHPGTLSDADGVLFIKPCVQQEIEFYQKATDDYKDFAAVMPKYCGTLTLNDPTDNDSLEEQLSAVAERAIQDLKEQAAPVAKEANGEAPAAETAKPGWKPTNKEIKTTTAVCVENSTYGFKKPNILDAKLGKRLWADDAPKEKRKRFDQITSETTNGSHGFRIAGMRVYKGSDNPEELDSEGYKVYSKEHGRFQVNKDNIVQEFHNFIFNKRAGIDEDRGKTIAQAFLDKLRIVEDVLVRHESRMYSASLLFIFEGDGEALQSALDEKATIPERAESVESAETAESEDTDEEQTSANGDGIPAAEGQDVDLGALLASGLIQGDARLLELSGDVSDEEPSGPSPIYSLKLIDFAHATWVPGEGPDENSLLGVRSLIKIFEELVR